MAQSIPLVDFGLDPLIDLNFHLWGSGQRWKRAIDNLSQISLWKVGHVYVLHVAHASHSLVQVYFPLLRGSRMRTSAEVKVALESCLRCLVMGQVVKPPASRVSRAGASERQRLGDAPTLDAG